MMPAPRARYSPKVFAVLVILSMVVGAVPAQLFLAPALAEGGSGDGGGTRGLLPSTESFGETSYRSLDSDNNSKRDAIEVRYTVRTTAAQEQVSVLIRAQDSNGNTIKFHYQNFTAFLFGIQERTWTFYAHYTGRYRLAMTLYDSQDNQEDTDRSGFFALDTGTVKRWITISTTPKDLDRDSYDDDVEVHVTNWTDADVPNAQVWINGTLEGKTDSSGKLTGKDYPKGWINIDVFWKDLHNTTGWESEGDGTVQGGLLVRAQRWDSDDDGLEDDVTITVRNQLDLPVRNAQIEINGTNYGTTNAQGELNAFNFRRGFWVVNATKLGNFGSTTFFSEGGGPGTELDEYFFDTEFEVLDLDNDGRVNDLRVRVDVDVDPPVASNVTVWANLSRVGDADVNYNVSSNFSVVGTETEWHDIYVKDITYGNYFALLTLLDEYDNNEDFDFSFVQLVRPSNHVNIETGVHYTEGDTEMDDILFRAFRVDEPEANITIRVFNETGVQVRTGITNENGRRWFRDMRDGEFNWTARDADGRLIEKGRVVIGARVQVETDVLDTDFDGFFDDFRVTAYNNVDRGVNTVTVTVWAPNGTEVTSNLTLTGQLVAGNLTKGTYEFNATYLGEELANGTFYSYGNVDEPFSVVVRPRAIDLDGNGRYDDVNVSVVDSDDSPLEFAEVYVDGSYRTKTDLNGYAEVKDLGWGIHTIEARYSGELARITFFSEGSSSSAKWTMLVMNDDEDYLDDLEDVGSTNDTVLLYYAEYSDMRPRQTRLWLVMDGHSQVIDVSRLGNRMSQGGMYRLNDDGVLDALLRFTYGKYSAVRTAAYFLEDAQRSNEEFFFEREMAGTMTDLGDKVDLLVSQFWRQTAMYFYELRDAVAYTAATQLTFQFPLKAIAQRVVDAPTTDAAVLGTLAIDRATGYAKQDGILVDMGRLDAFATALDNLAGDMAASYPGEGWAIQDSRNTTAYPYIEGDELAVYAARLGSQLANRLSTSALRTKANALKNSVDALTVKAASSTAGFALLFPNSTDAWESEWFQDLLNDSALMKATEWDEFLDEFWRFKGYGIEVHATAFDAESTGRKNDVRVHVNDTYGRDIRGARVHIDLSYEGDTDASGMLEAYNFTRGVHVVNVTWGQYSDEATFTSEGTIVPNQAPSVTITEPDEDEEVNATYVIRGTATDPDGIVSYVEVRFNGSAWQRATGRANWLYNWDTTAYADGTWRIEVRAYDGDLYSPLDTVNVTVYNPVVYADILLVDDDGGMAYDVYFTQALVAAGEDYDVISVARNADGPDADRLKEAKIVIWLTGEEDEGTLTAADRAALSDFLDDGGALWVTGQDVGRDLTDDGAVASAFLRDYLKANFVHDNADDYDLIGIPGEDISEGINVSIEGGTGARNQNYPSEIQPRPGATAVYLYNGTAEAAVKYGGATFRTVYFAFGFEGISTVANRNRVMVNVLDWLRSNQTTSPNEPPEAEAGNDIVTMEGEVAILRGTGTDPDGVIALYEWDVDGDGSYDWSNATTGILAWTYETAGNYTARLRVTDNMEESDTDTVNVEVQARPPNEPPVADAGEDVTVDQGDPVEFIMAGSDPDGTVVLFEWDYDGDGSYDEASPVAISTTHTYYEAGVYDAVLRVTDDEGATGTDVRRVTVEELVQNQPPTADAGPDIFAEVYEEVTLVGKGNDTDGYIATYKWDFDGDGVYDFTSTSTGTATHVYVVVGEFSARLLVIDDDGAADTDVAVVTIEAIHVNVDPVADAGPDTVVEAVQGEEVEFHGTGTDEDGFIVLYEWDFDGDGTYDWSSTQERTTTWTYNETGMFIARLRVTDNDDGTDEDTVRISVSSAVVPNKPPTAEAGGPYSGVAGSMITLEGSGEDPDGSVASYEWDFEGDGTFDHYSPGSGTVAVTYDTSGVFQAVLRVTDDDGAVAMDVADVVIARANAPPTVRVTSPSPGETVKGYYVLRGTSTDDSGVAKVEMRIDDGSWTRVSGTVTWSHDYDVSPLTVGQHTLYVRAVDTDGATSQVVEVLFLVEKAKKKQEEDSPGFTSALVLLAVLGAALVLGMERGRRRG